MADIVCDIVAPICVLIASVGHGFGVHLQYYSSHIILRYLSISIQYCIWCIYTHVNMWCYIWKNASSKVWNGFRPCFCQVQPGRSQVLDVTQAKSPRVVDVHALRFEMWPSTQVVVSVQMCANNTGCIEECWPGIKSDSQRTFCVLRLVQYNLLILFDSVALSTIHLTMSGFTFFVCPGACLGAWRQVTELHRNMQSFAFGESLESLENHEKCAILLQTENSGISSQSSLPVAQVAKSLFCGLGQVRLSALSRLASAVKGMWKQVWRHIYRIQINTIRV